uniref:Uncharacterized protein n=1 Tax=Cacopsylla melanoneura TaxID=428564 RepID=A0A8D9E718_9HEMI
MFRIGCCPLTFLEKVRNVHQERENSRFEKNLNQFGQKSCSSSQCIITLTRVATHKQPKQNRAVHRLNGLAPFGAKVVKIDHAEPLEKSTQVAHGHHIVGWKM